MRNIIRILAAIVITTILCLCFFFQKASAQATATGVITQGMVSIDTTGLKGSNGKNGTNGTTPKITVGNTTTLLPGSPASVLPQPTTDGIILNFGIPAGKQGEQGIPGTGVNTKPSSEYLIYTAADWDSAISGLITGKCMAIKVMQDGIHKNVVLPYKWISDSRRVCINLNGNNLFGSIKTADAPTYKLAEDSATKCRASIINGMISGSGQDTCIILKCFINCEVMNISFRDNAVGVYSAFTMGARIVGCDATNMKKAPYVADVLKIPGASDNKILQSNNIYYASDRAFNAAGGLYSFSSFGCNKPIYFDCTVEGNNPNYGFYFDDLGFTTVKQASYLQSHCEAVAGISMFYVKLNEGVINFDDTWNQKASPVLYEVNSASGATVNVTNNPNILASDKFKTTTLAYWCFYNNKKFDFTAAWVGAPPTQYDIHYKFQNGSRWDNSNGQLNGKKITTAP